MASTLAAELAIFTPLVAVRQRNWLQERVNAAQIAALALEAAPGMDITESLKHELLENAGVMRVALKRDGQRELRLDAMTPDTADMRVIDMRDTSTVDGVMSVFHTLTAPPGRLLRVLATPRLESGEFIEIVFPEAQLSQDVTGYAQRVLRTSGLITILAGWLNFVILNALLVRPMRRLTTHIEKFRDRPEDVSADINPSGSDDEVGRAENALADMEAQVRGSLRQQARLAGLGGAVAKLAHDLRNSLATAQLVSEQLSASEDPKVRQAAPRLERVIARASALAEAALHYGRADEPAPALQRVALSRAVEEAAADALAHYETARWRNDVPADAMVYADPEHLHRIVSNLVRNAAQACEKAKLPIRIEGRRRPSHGVHIVEIVDFGPGVPDAARAQLFQPFAAGTNVGGTGLGLAIARELANAMGGEVNLARSSADGAAFALILRAADNPDLVDGK
jgi:signal transduction histidine kinase